MSVEDDRPLEEEVVDVVEEPVEEVLEITNEEKEVKPEREYSETEIQAIAQGWKPPEEFDEGDKDFVSAEVYLAKGPLFDKIQELKNINRVETRRLQKQLEEVASSVQESKRIGYEQALKDLAAKRKEAIEYGDVESFQSLDTEYQDMRDKIKETQYVPAVAPEVSPEALSFQERNQDWFNQNTPENSKMLAQSIEMEKFLQKGQPYLTDEQRLQKIEKEMKELYPHRFQNVNKQKPRQVEKAASAAVSRTGSPDQIRMEDLDDNLKKSAEFFLSSDPSLKFKDFVKAAGLTNKR